MKRFLTLFLILLCAWGASGGPLDSMLPIKGAAGGGAKFPLTPPLTVSPSSAEIATPGYSFSLVATSPSSGAFSYSSSDPTIATVNGAGLVTIGITTGSTDITVTQAAVGSYFSAAQVVVPVVASYSYVAWDTTDVAVYFDGSDDVASGSCFGFPSGSSTRTMMAWILDVDAATPKGAEEWWIGYGAKSNIAIADTFANFFSSSNKSVCAGYYEDYYWTISRTASWTHWAMVYEGSGSMDQTKLYKNFTLLETGGWNYNGAATSLNTTTVGKSFFVGYWPGSPSGLKFKAANVSVWDKALSLEEIQKYGQFLPLGTEPNLVRAYHCDEGSGTTLIDECRSGYNMTLLNGATWTTKL